MRRSSSGHIFSSLFFFYFLFFLFHSPIECLKIRRFWGQKCELTVFNGLFLACFNNFVRRINDFSSVWTLKEELPSNKERVNGTIAKRKSDFPRRKRLFFGRKLQFPYRETSVPILGNRRSHGRELPFPY